MAGGPLPGHCPEGDYIKGNYLHGWKLPRLPLTDEGSFPGGPSLGGHCLDAHYRAKSLKDPDLTISGGQSPGGPLPGVALPGGSLPGHYLEDNYLDITWRVITCMIIAWGCYLEGHFLEGRYLEGHYLEGH